MSSSHGKDAGQSGTLYAVATPIGHLEDITRRALEILRQVDLVVAEDTRRTRKLLAHYDIPARLESYHGDSGPRKAAQILRTLQAGKDVALLSDSGTPAVSDPGAELVALCHENGIRVVPIPGASAVTAVFSVAGISAAGFIFAGYPPRQTGERRRFLESIADQPQPVIFYESPQRVAATLRILAEICPERRVVVGRELTKMHEELRVGTVEEVAAYFSEGEPRGEFTVVLEVAADAAKQPSVNEDDLRQAVQLILEAGVSARDAAQTVALLTNLGRNEAYDLIQRLQQG